MIFYKNHQLFDWFICYAQKTKAFEIDYGQSVIRNSNFQSLIYAGTITTGDDFNNYQSPGVYRYNGTPQHHPGIANDYGIASVMVTGSYIIQQAYSGTEQRWKHRHMVTGGASWTDWATDATKSDLRNIVTSRIFETGGKVTVPVGSEITADIPFTIPDGYKFLCINDSWVNGSYVIVSNRYRSGNSVKVVLRTYASNPITANVYADILFVLE